MPCYKPLRGFRGASTNPKTGKRPIVFNVSEGFRDLPVEIPCGQCIGCRLDRAHQWAIRCTHESKLHEEKCFVTLTYADSSLPPGGTLFRKDVQDFLKRLRKKIAPKKIRTFYCGEYGETGSLRPHYHLCIFGYWFERNQWKRLGGAPECATFTSEILEELWPEGHHTVQDFTMATAAYTARYVIKKVNGDRAEKHYQRIDALTGEIFQVIPEFIGMSLKPAIGKEWFDRFKDDVYPRDEVAIRGRLTGVPKYYDRQLEKENPDTLRKLKFARRRRASRRAKDNTPRRLRDREEVQTLRLTQLKRTL